jgi:hypothetical protein
MVNDVDRAIERCYRCIAEASLDQDCEHEQAAYAELHRLEQLVPAPREPSE